MDYKNSFVLYESVFVQYQRLMRRGKTFEAAAFIEAVMKYGLYGEVPDDDDEIWDYGFDGVVATISTAKERYTKRINIPEDELAIQVCYSLRDEETLNREIDALKKLPKRLECRRRIILTFDEETSFTDRHGTIEVIPCWKWMLE
jgi:predicted AAA+ superfamily ATPase